MSEKSITKPQIKWTKTKTDEGILYTYVSNETRTCLIKYDMTVEIRANGVVSNYPAEVEIADSANVKELLEKIQSARFCIGTQEGYNCKNVLFPALDRTNKLCVRCPECRVHRLKHYRANTKKKRHENREKLVGVSEEERICVIKDCPGRDNVRIRCYPIPPYDIEAWCANLKLDVSEVNESTRVCSRHFEESCKFPKVLKSGARPTLNLGHNDIPFPIEKLWRHKRFCCIVDCDSTQPPHRMYGFPQEEDRLKEWLLICDIKPSMLDNKHKFICRKHFDSAMFCNDALVKDAVPKMAAAIERSLTECVVRNCPGKDSEEIRLYCIPEDDIDAYCAILNKKKSDIEPDARICSRHFEKKFLLVTKIRDGARPTLNLGKESFVLPSLQPIRRIPYKYQCSIVGCDVTSPPEKLFMFPTNEERSKEWLSICNIKKGRRKAIKSLRICANHFDPAMIVDQRLKKNAVPISEDRQDDAEDFYDSAQLENDVENLSDDDSDLFDGLECKSSCHTCVQVLSDCKKYRRHYMALDEHIQQQQATLEALKHEKEQLMAEFEGRMMI